MWVVVAIVWGVFLIGTLKRVRRRTDSFRMRPATSAYRSLMEMRNEIDGTEPAEGEGRQVLSKKITAP